MGFFTNILKGNAKPITATTTPSKQSTKATIPKIGGLASVIAAGIKKAGSKKTTSTPSTPSTPAVEVEVDKSVILQWNNVKFFANANKVVGLRDLAISATCETEDKEDSGNKYVKLKNKKGFEVTMTAYLDKRLGIKDVRGDAVALAGYAAAGTTGYIYCKGDKLVSTNMMATSAKIKNIQMTPGGSWISCEIDVTFKACSKLGSGNDSPQTGGNDNTNKGKYYKVQISGMSELKIWATSAQQAIQKACGSTYTGYVSVDGSSYHVTKGKIDKNSAKDTIKKDTIKKVGTAATQQKEAKKTSGLFSMINKP